MATSPLTARGLAMPAPPAALPLHRSDAGRGSTSGERLLVAAIERALRAPQGWSVVALHLSRLASPGPRAHHGRIARAVIHEAAQRADGQHFALRNGDMVLLYRDAAAAAAALPQTLRHLFGREVVDPETVVSGWHLPHAGAQLLAYTAARIAELEAPVAEECAGVPASIVDAAAAALTRTQAHDLVRRQAAVMLEPAASGTGVTMRQAYRELTLSTDALDPRLRLDGALLRHFARRLDQRTLQILQRELGGGTPLDMTAGGGLTLHINLSLAGVLSDAFLGFAQAWPGDRPALGIEVALVEVIADPDGYARVCERLRQVRARLVLDDVSHLALLLTRPMALQADVIKLEWSPGIAELRGDERAELARAIAEADPGRLILQRADSEAAVRWGLAQGVRCFQGHHIDQMLAARRMLGCRGAPACTLRQCVERAQATGGAGRAECTNLALLDAGMPTALPPATM